MILIVIKNDFKKYYSKNSKIEYIITIKKLVFIFARLYFSLDFVYIYQFIALAFNFYIIDEKSNKIYFFLEYIFLFNSNSAVVFIIYFVISLIYGFIAIYTNLVIRTKLFIYCINVFLSWLETVSASSATQQFIFRTFYGHF